MSSRASSPDDTSPRVRATVDYAVDYGRDFVAYYIDNNRPENNVAQNSGDRDFDSPLPIKRVEATPTSRIAPSTAAPVNARRSSRLAARYPSPPAADNPTDLFRDDAGHGKDGEITTGDRSMSRTQANQTAEHVDTTNLSERLLIDSNPASPAIVTDTVQPSISSSSALSITSTAGDTTAGATSANPPAAAHIATQFQNPAGAQVPTTALQRQTGGNRDPAAHGTAPWTWREEVHLLSTSVLLDRRTLATQHNTWLSTHGYAYQRGENAGWQYVKMLRKEGATIALLTVGQMS